MANLKVRFRVWQVEGQCDVLYFQDVTPDVEEDETGYGGSLNPTRNEIDKTRLYIAYNGGVYLFDNLYKPRLGKVLALHPQFFTKERLVRGELLADPELACLEQMGGGQGAEGKGQGGLLSKFEDGCYKVLYEVYSDTKVPARKCTYEATGPWETGWTFLAIRDGAEYNMTSSVTDLGGEFWFKAEKTTAVHEKWRVKDADGVTKHRGVFEKYDCFNSSTARQTTAEPVVVSSANMELTMLCRTKLRQSHGAYSIVVAGCKKTKGLDESRALELYSLASDKLVGLQERTEGCDCGCSKSTLREINEIFDYIGL
jgi:hypothetical protein